MAYLFLKHRADIQMTVTALSYEELFSEALAGMMSLLRARKKRLRTGQAVRFRERIIEARAESQSALLVDFLNEMLAFVAIHKETYPAVRFKALSGNEVKAVVRGVPVSRFLTDVKAVARRKAEVKEDPGGEWKATLVFDI